MELPADLETWQQGTGGRIPAVAVGEQWQPLQINSDTALVLLNSQNCG